KPAEPAGPAFRTLPWGIADGAGKLGWLTNDRGQVEAVDLATGKVKWTSTEKGKPLALVKDKVAIQAAAAKKANAVRVVFLDAKGKTAKEPDAIPFPDWVSVGTTHGRSFASAAWVDGDNLYLRWAARAWYAGGAKPTPAIEKAARKNADGVAKIVVDTGKV